MHADDRRTRLIAFAVITLVFVVSMSALIYWAVNVASPKISSNVAANSQAPNTLSPNENTQQTQGLRCTLSFDDGVTASQPF
jgi:hypothetical protein